MADEDKIVRRATIRYKDTNKITIEYNANGIDSILDNQYSDLRCYNNQYYTGGICTNHDIRHSDTYTKIVDGMQSAHICEGHRSKNNNAISINNIKAEDIINVSNITQFVYQLNNEIEQRQKSSMYKGSTTKSYVTPTNTTDGYNISKFSDTVNKLSIIETQIINELNNHIINTNKDTDMQQYKKTILPEEIINNSQYSDIVQAYKYLYNDCICYCDCQEYSICYCYAHCNHY